MTLLPLFIFSLIAVTICLAQQQQSNPVVNYPPNCPSFEDNKSCLKPKINNPWGKVDPPWCEWVNGMCRWSEPNIAGYFCNWKTTHACRLPFCYVESDKCHGTAYACLNRRTVATCHQEAHCFWYKPGDTPDNPDFSICGHEP